MKLKPNLHPGIYVFSKIEEGEQMDLSTCIATFKESEGMTVILPKTTADQLGLAYDYEAAWITLQLDTALDMVGITAKFSTDLATAGISCNVVAAFHHDHIFVATADAESAIQTLENIDLSI